MNNNRKYYFLYTSIFIITAILVFLPFGIYNKSFIYGDGGGDGISQHYTALAYYGEYLRSIVRSLFREHKLFIPMWDMTIGYGADIITTLNYYVLGDPFALLSIFFPAEKTELLYNLLLLLRLFCAGIAFSAYCRYMKKDTFSSLISSFIYIFCGYALLAPLLHPYFANPMIWFPLILLGMEKIFHGESPVLYIIILSVAALSNFYFLYMIVIMVIIYAIFRYLMLFSDLKPRTVAKWFLTFLGYSAIAAGISMVLLLPALKVMLSTGRVGLERTIPWFYPVDYYKQFQGTFLSGTINGYYTYMGYTGLSLCALISLFLRRGQDRLWKSYWLLLTLFLLFPYAGHIMNGFAYVTNRWIWAYSFLVAFLTASELPALIQSSRKFKIKVLLICFLYLCCMWLVNRGNLNHRVWASVLLLLCTCIMLFITELKVRPVFVCLGILSIVLVNLVTTSWFIYLPRFDNQIAKYQDRGTAWNEVCQSVPSSLLKNIENTEQYRYDTILIPGNKLLRNSAMLTGTKGTSFYFSTPANSISEFQKELYLNFSMDQTYENLDGRSFLAALESVKYEIVPNGAEINLPYGFDNQVFQDSNYTIYEDKLALPLAYWYDSYIPKSEYDSMSVSQKQQAVLQGAVINCVPQIESSIKKASLSFSDTNIPYKILPGDGLELLEDSIKVTADNVSLTLEFEGLPESETYVVVENLQYIHLAESNILSENLNFLQKLKRKIINRPVRADAYFSIFTDTVGKSISVRMPNDNYYCGKHNFLANMGYSSTPKKQLVLNFPMQGIYTLDNLSIICQPVSELSQQKQKLAENQIQIQQISQNEYEFHVSNQEAGILCFSAPYSSGWSAVIDGKKADIFQLNTVNMGVELLPGSHKIIFQYKTPFLRPGFIISMLSIFLLIFIRTRIILKRVNR